ncbi:PLP-dependent aminotransferase family protein [Inquilinus sp. Marseille-Q2685]|uniref:MocR-like pyridoxine biosynthesis transcription factor PdxR n=1 Tax=Inquilinus sp. Marseille-Q2685 TaxID=2866581 RepID=UPI001CE3D818|nr:PLP-dependent aminotransferase family protein [Inquilinus sp. Marseille-Q2685]
MAKPLSLQLDRSAKTPLTEQIRKGISAAIESGVLAPGARLPSWLDLAAQLGVARGTVRSAYERLSDDQLIVASRATGTRVAARPARPVRKEPAPDPGSFMEMYRELTAGPAIFQMGVPAQETLPAKLLARIRAQAIRAEASAPAIYPDPRGEFELRREIAAYLAVARGIECSPSQVIVTAGYSSGLGLALRVLGLEGRKAWMEDPGFPFTRHGLELARLAIVPVPVDADGIDVDHGLRHAPDAALAVVTPGQQAPLGTALSLARRLRLLEWAAQDGAWVIEDDYLGELQLKGRATPALASLDRAGRGIHIGSFSKTISPTWRLGFVVAPAPLASRFAEVAACLAPAPGPGIQLATAAFMREGHYLRHLRRTKRLYAAQRDALLDCLRPRAGEVTVAGLAALLPLPAGAPDLTIAREMLAFGLAPIPLSLWYASPASARSGLLLGIATAPQRHLARSCDRLWSVIERFA